MRQPVRRRSIDRWRHYREQLAPLVVGDSYILGVDVVDGSFTTNPDPDIVIEPHQVLIAVGNDDDFRRLGEIAK